MTANETIEASVLVDALDRLDALLTLVRWGDTIHSPHFRIKTTYISTDFSEVTIQRDAGWSRDPLAPVGKKVPIADWERALFLASLEHIAKGYTARLTELGVDPPIPRSFEDYQRSLPKPEKKGKEKDAKGS